MSQEIVPMCLARRSISTLRSSRRGEFGRWVVEYKVLCRLSDNLWQEEPTGDLASGVEGCFHTQVLALLPI